MYNFTFFVFHLILTDSDTDEQDGQDEDNAYARLESTIADIHLRPA